MEGSGEEAPELVLSDYRLRQGDGLLAIEMVRQRFGQVPSVLVTGDSAPRDLARLHAAGVFTAQQGWAYLLEDDQPIIVMDRVTIRGHYDGQTLWDVSTSTVYVPWTQPQDPGYREFSEVSSRSRSGTDVRMLCNIPGEQELASTTSHDDAIARQDAARVLVAIQNFRWVGS